MSDFKNSIETESSIPSLLEWKSFKGLGVKVVAFPVAFALSAARRKPSGEFS